VSGLEARPWLEQSLALWEAVLRDLLRRGEVTGVHASISALALSMNPLWLEGNLDADSGYAFLREAVPWMPRGDLEQAVRTYSSAFESEPRKKEYLEGLLLLLEDWVPDGVPPDPLPSLAGPDPPT